MLTNFLRDEQGATAIEYGLIASLIAIAIMVGMTALATALNANFNEVSAHL